MRALLSVLVLVVAGCGGRSGGEAPVVQAAPEPDAAAPPATVAPATVVASTPPIGPAAPAPPVPTIERAGAAGCTLGPPIELGKGEPGTVQACAAFGATGGLFAWSPRPDRVAVRPIGPDGAPTGPEHAIDVPGKLDCLNGLRALDGFYLAFVTETDFSGHAPIARVAALVLRPDGTPVGPPTRLDTGKFARIDEVSPAAAHGVIVFARPTPSTGETRMRFLTVHVAADGALTQAIQDVTPTKDDRRAALSFAFTAAHTVVIDDGTFVVDGQVRPLQGDEPGMPLLALGPDLDDTGVSVLGASSRDLEADLRYGRLGLDGSLRYEQRAVPRRQPMRAPFEEPVEWALSTGDGDVQLHRVSGLRGTTVGEPTTLSIPGLSSGIWTDLVWSGTRFLVVHAAGGALRVAPLDCR